MPAVGEGGRIYGGEGGRAFSAEGGRTDCGAKSILVYVECRLGSVARITTSSLIGWTARVVSEGECPSTVGSSPTAGLAPGRTASLPVMQHATRHSRATTAPTHEPAIAPASVLPELVSAGPCWSNELKAEVEVGWRVGDKVGDSESPEGIGEAAEPPSAWWWWVGRDVGTAVGMCCSNRRH